MPAHTQNKLTVAKIRSLKEAGMYADGNGLYLIVEASGSKRWVQRIVIQKKRCDLGLGSVSTVTLAEARDKAIQNKRVARSGGNPLEDKRRDSQIPVFSDAAKRVHALHLPTWKNGKHAGQWLNTLEAYAYAKIGEKLVSQISTADILAVLTPIWTVKPETAKRVRQRISTILRWAMAQGWRADDPAQNIQQALPKLDAVKVVHQRAAPYQDVGGIIRTVQKSGAAPTTKLAFEFLWLTAVRSGDVRGAVWSEFNLDAKVWTIPRVKGRNPKPHIVPLSKRALEILEQARALQVEANPYVFPGVEGGVISDSTLSKLLLELKVPAVPHGGRSSFRDWAAEQTTYPREVAEAALAHVLKSKVEAAYARTDHLEKRRGLMQDWADYLQNGK